MSENVYMYVCIYIYIYIYIYTNLVYFVFNSLSCAHLLATPQTAVHQASLSLTISQN